MIPESPPETREDPRVKRTRKLIRDALGSLVEQKAFSNISVQDIAERATINRATFYAHFDDKSALLEDLVRHRYRDMLARHNPRSAKDVSMFLETIALDTFEHVGSHKKTKVDKEYEPRLERALQDELYTFLLPVLGESAALVVSSAVIGATLQWRACRYRDAADGLVERLVLVLSTGVCLRGEP